MEEKIFKTSIVLGVFFIAAIQAHGNNQPPFYIKAIEVIGGFGAIFTALVSGIIMIWAE